MRIRSTSAEQLLELTDGGYISLGEPHDASVKEAKESILANAPKVEADAEDLKGLLESTEIPRATAQRAVKELESEGVLSKIGEGKRGSPFKYFLTEIRFRPTSDIGGQKESFQEETPEALV